MGADERRFKSDKRNCDRLCLSIQPRTGQRVSRIRLRECNSLVIDRNRASRRAAKASNRQLSWPECGRVYYRSAGRGMFDCRNQSGTLDHSRASSATTQLPECIGSIAWPLAQFWYSPSPSQANGQLVQRLIFKPYDFYLRPSALICGKKIFYA